VQFGANPAPFVKWLAIQQITILIMILLFLFVKEKRHYEK